MYDGLQLRVVPLDGCYMLQRYRPDYDDWMNVAVYDTEAQALQRASKYDGAHMSKNEILKVAQEAGIHSAMLFYHYGSQLNALTDREQAELASIEHFGRLLIAAIRAKELA